MVDKVKAVETAMQELIIVAVVQMNLRPPLLQKHMSREESERQYGAIVVKVIHALQPLLVKTVTTAVSSAVKTTVSSAVKTTSTQILQSLKDDKRDDVSMLKCETQKQKFELDRLEQCSLKDSIRISGIDENDNENTIMTS